MDALVGFRTSKESPSHVSLSSSICYLSHLVVIYPSYLCHSLSCFFLLPAPRPSSQLTAPRSTATSPTLRPPTPQLPVTSTYGDQFARGRVLPGIGQLIQGPARASGWVLRVLPAHTGTSSCQWSRLLGKEAGHLGRRQAIGKGGQGHLRGGRPFRKEARAHTEKKTRRKEGKEGREEKKRQEKRREGKEKGERKSKRAESDTCISHSHETTTRGDHNGGGLGSEALSRGMQRERRSIVT